MGLLILYWKNHLDVSLFNWSIFREVHLWINFNDYGNDFSWFTPYVKFNSGNISITVVVDGKSELDSDLGLIHAVMTAITP